MQTKTIPHSGPAPPLAEGQGRLLGIFAGEAAQRQVLVYLLICVCAAVFLAHSPALSARAEFLDDSQYVFKNPLVRNPSWRSLGRFFAEVSTPSTVRGYYQPLTMASLMVDRFLGGGYEGMRIYHRTSLWLHVANTALVATFLYLLFGSASGGLIASGVALLFGLHPMSVESICWISERKTVLATFFALLSLISYVRFTRERRIRHYVVCFLTYALALLAKPITVPLPAMMLLMDYWPLDRLRRRSLTEKLPLFAVGAVFAIITYVSQSRTAPVYVPGDYNPLHVPLILGHNIIFYLYTFFWPVRLSAYCEFPSPMSLAHPMVLMGVVGTCVLIAVLVFSRRWTRAPLAGWLIFFVMILPAMGIISVTPTIAANRYAYLPSVGFLMVLAALLAWMGRARADAGHGGRAAITAALVLVLAGLETIPMRHYLAQWRDTTALYEHMLSLAPHSPGIHANLGVALGENGQTDLAFEHFRQALAVEPDNERTHYNFAVILEKTPGKEDEAIEHYEKVLEKPSPMVLTSRLNLGNIFLRRGQLDQAIAHYREAVKANPAFIAGHCNLGKTLVLAGESAKGIEHLREAVRQRPGFLLATKDLAWFLATHPSTEVRDAKEAVHLAQRAQAMTQGRNAGVLDTLAAAYALEGRYKKAVETAQKALEIAKRVRSYEQADQIQERLRLYQFECPYYEDPKVQLDRLVAKAKRAEDGESRTEDGELDSRVRGNDNLEAQDETETMAVQ